MGKRILLILLTVVVIYLASTSFVAVDPTAFVYVTQFGRHVVTYDGGDNVNDAGLHLCWPWPVQSVQRVDRRLQVFDLRGLELLTRDRDQKTVGLTLTIDAYVCWRIVDKSGVDLFIRKVGTPEQASRLLEKQIGSQLAALISNMSMGDLVNEEKGKVTKSLDILQEGLVSQKARIRREYGITIEDIRLRRLSYPDKVRMTIFQRIQSEREKVAAEFRRQGATEAAKILSEARKDARIKVALAQKLAEDIRSEAVAQGDAIRNAAHARDREFYRFLKKLQDYGRILSDNKTVLYLSTQREIFDVLLNPNGTTRTSKPRAVKKAE